MQQQQPQTLPHFLRKQALSPATHLTVLTPTLFVYRDEQSGQQEEVRLDVPAAVDQLLEYDSIAKFFEYRRIHRVALQRSAYHWLQPLLKEEEVVKHESNLSGLNPAQIALNAEKKAEEIRAYHAQQDYRKMVAEGITDTRRYHLKSLSQECLVSCPVTGIVFSCLMPSIPVFLQQRHPLAELANTQATLEWFLITSNNPGRLSELDTPVLAGMLLVLFRAKHLLSESETSALSENAALQYIPQGTLIHYLTVLHRSWSLDKIWQNMPHIRLNAEGQSVLATLEDWFKRVSLHISGKPLTDIDTQARLFEATRFKSAAEKTIKIYSAETSQHKKILQTKSDASLLYKKLSPLMSPVLKSLVHATLRDLIVVTQEAKNTVSEALSKQFLGTPQQSAAADLISLICAVETGHIAKELGRASDDFALPKRSVAEILASKLSKGN